MQPPTKNPLPEASSVDAYIRPPRVALEGEPSFSVYVKPDTFGLEVRLDALRRALRQQSGVFTQGLDLGGNCGYFLLSLMADGLVKSGRVEDLDESALAMGRAFAEAMGVSQKISFARAEVSLSKVEALQDGFDLVMSLNLIHHAGATFDVDLVRAIGWETYARRWLIGLQRSAGTAVVGVGFKGEKPKHWTTGHRYGFDWRPMRFARLCEQSGWEVVYDANVEDLTTLGLERANGRQRHLRGVGTAAARRILARSGVRRQGADGRTDKTRKYHLYVLRRVP